MDLKNKFIAITYIFTFFNLIGSVDLPTKKILFTVHKIHYSAWGLDTKETPLLKAISQGHTFSAAKIICNGADINATCAKKGYIEAHKTPLMLALERKNFTIAHLLLLAGADVNKVFNGPDWPHAGVPVLGFALESGSINIIKKIINGGANVNCWIESGITFENSSNKKLSNIRNLSPLLYAIAHRMPKEIIQLLIDAGANVNDMVYNYWSPLHLAMFMDQNDIVELLLAHGADATLKDAAGQTPSDLACFAR